MAAKDRIAQPWGSRTPYGPGQEWPARVDGFLAEGDPVEVASARGAVRARARISGIRPGVLFVPFHYGYWDVEAGAGRERAANEMTVTDWDPVSKQPLFKTSAARLRLVSPSDGRPVVGRARARARRRGGPPRRGRGGSARSGPFGAGREARGLLAADSDPGLNLLADLRRLHLGAAGVSVDWELLGQGAQAVKDADLLEVCRRCHPQTLRQMSWANAMLKVLSPQVWAR
jgi:hypothetical protein